MSTPKTVPTKQSVAAFLNSVEDEQKRKDARRLDKLMREVTGEKPVMWGPSIVGYGRYHYKYASGREGDWPLTGFSPRKQNLTIYVMPGFDKYPHLMKKLGKHKTGVGCLYFKRLSDLDEAVLKELIAKGVAYLKEKYGD
jgi:hypothetical protein